MVLTRGEETTARALGRRFAEADEQRAAAKTAALHLLAGLEDVSEVALADELDVDRNTVRAWLTASAHERGVPPRPPRPGRHGRELTEDELPAVLLVARQIRHARSRRDTVRGEILTFLATVDGCEERALATALGVDLPRTLRPWMRAVRAAASDAARGRTK
jgi:transposase-like protein